jgi:hypothetical protein
MPKILETAQARITKVVVLFSRSPTKLGLHFSKFSTIFYGFYKNQQNTYTIWDSLLRPGPWQFWFLTKIPSVHTKHPEKKEGDAIGSSGHGGGGSGQNSGEELAREGRGRVEDGPGLTTGRFVVEVGTEGRLAAGLGDADWRRPRDCWLWWGGGSVGKVSKPESFSRCKRRWRAPWLGMRRVRPGGSWKDRGNMA